MLVAGTDFKGVWLDMSACSFIKTESDDLANNLKGVQIRFRFHTIIYSTCKQVLRIPKCYQDIYKYFSFLLLILRSQIVDYGGGAG